MCGIFDGLHARMRCPRATFGSQVGLAFGFLGHTGLIRIFSTHRRGVLTMLVHAFHRLFFRASITGAEAPFRVDA